MKVYLWLEIEELLWIGGAFRLLLIWIINCFIIKHGSRCEYFNRQSWKNKI